MPFEVSIDTKKKKGLLRASTLQKLEALQDSMAVYPELSKPVSMVEVVKFSKQAFFKGNPDYYELPNNQERNFLLSYIPNLEGGGSKSIINSFVDSTLQKTRISVQMANIGTTEIDALQKSIKPTIDKIFPPDDFIVNITGSSIVFLEGTNYLVKNLISSLLLALLVIAILMALTFTSFKMVVISLIPNLIPQLLTAAMMGYAGISIKPSTILIFSIALGISVDNTIHFLSRYRLQLIMNDWKIKESVLAALLETGFSMIYSAVVLFFGFAIFILSSFGGTEALGYLVSFTLLAAMLSNLFVLPSLLLTLDKRITTKAFREPLLEMLDEEDDIELDDLEIEAYRETKKE
jgi:predicted RND superfamily exporter protein